MTPTRPNDASAPTTHHPTHHTILDSRSAAILHVMEQARARYADSGALDVVAALDGAIHAARSAGHGDPPRAIDAALDALDQGAALDITEQATSGGVEAPASAIAWALIMAATMAFNYAADGGDF